MVMLDTNILIDALRRKNGATVLEQILKTTPREYLSISVISIQELYQGKSVAESKKESDMQTLLAPLKILPYSYEVAKLAGEIVRTKHFEITFPDAAIAATAIVNHVPLYTLNQKDFLGIPNLILSPVNGEFS